MAQEIGLKIKIDAAEGAQSVSELKKAIKDLTSEAIQAGQRGDTAMRSAYIKAAGEAKDKLQELNKEIHIAGDTGNKLQAIQGVGVGIAHGFEAAKGAAALFGSSGKAVEEQLLKIQSVMALTQGITGIFEGIKSVKALANTFGMAQKAAQLFGVSAAAAEDIATGGLTLLIGGIVAVAANFESISNWFGSLFSSSNNDAIEAQDEAIRNLAKSYESLSKYENESMDMEMQLMKIRGESQEKIDQQEIDNIKEKIKLNEQQWDKLMDISDKTDEDFKNLDQLNAEHHKLWQDLVLAEAQQDADKKKGTKIIKIHG